MGPKRGKHHNRTQTQTEDESQENNLEQQQDGRNSEGESATQSQNRAKTLEEVEAEFDEIMIGPYKLSYIREYEGRIEDENMTQAQIEQVRRIRWIVCMHVCLFVCIR